MKKHLFLTGPSGYGKTAMIREALGDALPYAGGFITECKRSEDGSLLGIDLYPAAAAADFSAYDAHRFLDFSSGKPSKDNEVFRNVGVQLLREAAYYPYAMIDEFGGFEVIIPQFRSALADFLNLDIPIIGVIKGPEGVQELQDTFGLGERFSDMAALIRQVIAGNVHSEVIEMRRPGDARAERHVKKWADEYIRRR